MISIQTSTPLPPSFSWMHFCIIKDLVVPCLQLCQIAEGQRYTKRLNERQVTALLKATCQRPPDRENAIKAVGLVLFASHLQ